MKYIQITQFTFYVCKTFLILYEAEVLRLYILYERVFRERTVPFRVFVFRY